MKEFVLIEIRDLNTLRHYAKNRIWKKNVILPYFSDAYICFSKNKEYSFNDLIKLFLKENDDEKIGSISYISEKYPVELYSFLKNNQHFISLECCNFLLKYVIHDYLPLILPIDKLETYTFNDEYADDVWVNILKIVRGKKVDGFPVS